jgi:transketolase
MTHAAFEHKGPVYLRLTGGMRAPIVYKEDFELVPGKANTLREGVDIAIIATGSMVHTSLTAAGHLADRGVQATVIDMHTIKPLDVATLQQHLDKKLLVTVEEHSVTGGLGVQLQISCRGRVSAETDHRWYSSGLSTRRRLFLDA